MIRGKRRQGIRRIFEALAGPATRFSHVPRWVAWCVLISMAMLTMMAATPPVRPLFGKPFPAFDDGHLYRNIANRVANGQGYYASALVEHQAHRYPIHPALVFREPTTTWLTAFLRFDPLRLASLFLLAATTTICLRNRLDGTSIPSALRLAGGIAIATGTAVAGTRDGPFLSEIWAALFVALSIAAYYPRRWALSVVFGLVACLFRELAVPYLCAMLAFALWERRWAETLSWVGAIGVFGVLFALHLHEASVVADPAIGFNSPGWLYFGGWTQALSTARWNILFHFLPAPVLSLVVCCGLVGLIGWRDPWVARCAVIVTVYFLAMTIVGRPDNDYWGILYTPLLPLGLALAPAALRDIVSRAFVPARTVAGR